jgi:formate dehydrogenase major subunit
MPARHEEVEEALREGVQMHFLCDLSEVRSESGRVSGVRLQRMTLGDPDASGRPRPVPLAGQFEDLDGDAVIPALGQTVGGALFDDPGLAGLRREADGRVWVDPATQATSLAGIYAGGDTVSGAATAVRAMAQGRRAALAIFGDLAPGEVPASRLVDRLLRKPFPGHQETPQAKIREEMPQLSLQARNGSFQEVDEGYREACARREAGRCLQCHREL